MLIISIVSLPDTPQRQNWSISSNKYDSTRTNGILGGETVVRCRLEALEERSSVEPWGYPNIYPEGEGGGNYLVLEIGMPLALHCSLKCLQPVHMHD